MATKRIEEKGTVVIPRARKGEDPNFFVCINGKAYLIPKGEATEVPPEVAYEVKRAQEAEAIMFDRADALQQASK